MAGPGGLAPAAAATRARPENCTPASHSPRAGESPATAAPDTGPSPADLWPPRDIAPPNADGARTHHPLRRHLRTEVAPVVPPLAVGGILTDQPARTTRPRRRHAPAAHRDKPPSHPALAPLPPGHRTPRPRRLAATRASARCAGPPCRDRATAKSSWTATTKCCDVSPGHPGSWGCRRSRRPQSHRRHRTPHSRARSSRSRAICGLVWKMTSSGTFAFSRWPASLAEYLGR